MPDASLPEMITLEDAFRAMYCMTDQYVALEREPDEGLVLFQQYLHSDPARWEDWRTAVRRALEGDPVTDPLTENLYRGE